MKTQFDAEIKRVMIHYLHDKFELTGKRIAGIMGMNKSSVSRILNNSKPNQELMLQMHQFFIGEEDS